MARAKVNVSLEEGLVAQLKLMSVTDDRPFSRTVERLLKIGLEHADTPPVQAPKPLLERTEQEMDAYIKENPFAQDLLQNFDQPEQPTPEGPDPRDWWKPS
ncbi:MAG TPA: hypothetical protein VKD72_28865 [Gemmataceae bacterium]|nr:hypothetical protein [Gemmataceae bacterium]